MIEQLDASASGPEVLLIHLLNRCNLKCQHCYLRAGPSMSEQLPLKLAKRCLEESESLGVSRVFLSGGEPLLYEGLPALLRLSARLPDVELRVSTNGTLIGPEWVKLLKDCDATVQISIDGTERYHDSFRGRVGAFQDSARGIQMLVSAAVPVTVVTTVCRDNMAFLPWLANWAAAMGVQRISIQPLMGLGRGSDLMRSRLTADELSDLFLKVSDLAHRFRDTGLRFSLSYRSTRFLRLHPCAAYVCDSAKCHRRIDMEIKKLVVREDATVLPEVATLDRRFSLGRLQDGTLGELLIRYFEDGYARFKSLCRKVYEENIPIWNSPMIPWNELLSECSQVADYESLVPTSSESQEVRSRGSGV